MPGLIGTIHQNSNSIIGFKKAFDALTYDYSNIKDELYQDELIIAQRTHLGIIGEQSSPNTSNNNYAWVEGEIYNHQLLEKELGQNFTSFSEILLHCYERNLLQSILAMVDGYFCAVIYDKINKKILLISDRYGLKPIYYHNSTKYFCWASEVKAFKFLLPEIPEFNKHLVQPFIDLNYIPNDETWFNNVLQLKASSILIYNIDDKQIKEERYWTWSNVITNRSISFNEASEQFFNELQSAVNLRMGNSAAIGVSLSGGIDSRVILSLIEKKVPTVTFGLPNTVDVVLAAKVAKKNNNPHKHLKLSNQNWFDNRIDAVWRTDGLSNLLHLHTPPNKEELEIQSKINLNGFAGGPNLSGRWITNENKRINKHSASIRLGSYTELTNINDTFYNCEHEDAYYIDTRLRRFSTGGSRYLGTFQEQRKPFMDAKLLDFLLSLPDEYRINGKLLYHCIENNFPKLFKNIFTTQGIYPVTQIGKRTELIKYKLRQIPVKLKLRKDLNWAYHNYSHWINQPEFISFLQNTLAPSSSLLSNFSTINPLQEYLQPLLKNQYDYSEQLMAALTLEIWLRQVYDVEIPLI